MLSHITFDQNPGPYKLAILIKESAMRREQLEVNYVKPLTDRGFRTSEILALSLEYNQAGKAPAKLIKEHLGVIGKILEKQNINHVLVADAAYFKVLTKSRRAEPYYGYVLPASIPGVQVALTVNYTQLFHNPTLRNRMMLGVRAVAKSLNQDKPLFFDKLTRNVTYPAILGEVENTLKDLLKHPTLTCDIETRGLKLLESRILTIAFAWSQEEGTAFSTKTLFTKTALKRFFKAYTGKLIFHNAPFDTGRLIYQLFMNRDGSNMKGMLQGLDILYRDTDDTQTLTYLATNTTAGNELSLKKQAFEFAGNWAIEEIQTAEFLEIKELLEYNATDALATWFVYEKHRETVRETQEEVYQRLFRPALKVLTQMELCGMPMNMTKVADAKGSMNQEYEMYRREIAGSPLVHLFENEMRLSMALEATAKLKHKVKSADDYLDEKLNPRSTKQLRHLFYEHLKLPVFRFTDTKLESTDGKTLSALIAHIEKTYDL